MDCLAELRKRLSDARACNFGKQRFTHYLRVVVLYYLAASPNVDRSIKLVIDIELTDVKTR